MPIYEYRCQECGHELEAIRKISDPPLQDCPECGNPSLQKKVSAPSFRLKGGGWYETDFKKSGDRQRNLAGDDGGETKGDAKEAPGKSDKSDKSSGGAQSAEKSSAGSKGDSKPASPSTKNQAA